ncbi:hypothetical protein FRB90_010649 [Tulasnella sp. 427]|nr:hypothetical protein FRB90_010649 [Tulasnella sp. 427]
MQVMRVSSLPDFKSLGIRLKSPRLCDPTVKQYSGYIDFPTDKHMFFWFFESRRSPAKAPLVLSFGGGPACSSLTGPLSGVGPCNVINGGQDVEYNKVALNDYANVLYIDQLVNVGFSYSTVNVTDSATSAEDVYVFLQVFFKGFPEYAKAPLSVLSAGYGGVHGPYIASTIQRKNKELDEQLRAHPQINSSTVNINLDTVMLGNAMTDVGEAAKDTATLIPDLLADGIRFLIYGGTNDYFCSPPGYLQWMPKLNTVFRDAFIQAPLHPWSANNNGTASGMVKAAGEKTSSAGSFTYASIYEAGHSASTDQPEAAYYLFKRWLDNKSVH